MVTIISGTNRPLSSTFKVAKYYQSLLAKKGLDCQILDLQFLPIGIILSDLYGNRSSEFKEIQSIVNQTEKFLFIIPEYNGSFPGVLKTFIDACDFPSSFLDKKAALVGISSGKYGNVRGIEHFAGVCSYLHLNVMPLRIHIANVKQELNADGEFFEKDTLHFIEEQANKFIEF